MSSNGWQVAVQVWDEYRTDEWFLVSSRAHTWIAIDIQLINVNYDHRNVVWEISAE